VQAWNANKVIVIMRNPLDTLFSWLHACSMNCHHTKSPFDYETLYPNYFDWWVKDCCTAINKWSMQMMQDAKSRSAPILFIRFEDMVANPEPEFRTMMSFLLGKKDLAGTNAERRIQEVLAMGQGATRVYDLKETTRRFKSNHHRYTQAQLDWIGDNMKEMLHFFGYAKLPEDPENMTGFFEFSGEDTELTR